MRGDGPERGHVSWFVLHTALQKPYRKQFDQELRWKRSKDF